MILVRVERHSAVTHKVTKLARMKIVNVGGNDKLGDYYVKTLLKPKFESSVRWGTVFGYARQALPVWTLVARALLTLGNLPAVAYKAVEKCPVCKADIERPYDEKCRHPEYPSTAIG